MQRKRPEYTGPAYLFYDEKESKKYSNNSRMIQIQGEMSERALELLALPKNEQSFILDLGCGSGLSGECLTEGGHYWIGIDISRAMLDIALERNVEGGLILGDLGHGMPFRPGTFDGAISISALQWLCCADSRHHSIHQRLYKIFSTLYASLKRNARAIFQIYPDSDAQIELITKQAMRAGFTGGLVIDFPNSSKAKKIFLCLFAGINLNFKLPSPKLENDAIVSSAEDNSSGDENLDSEQSDGSSDNEGMEIDGQSSHKMDRGEITENRDTSQQQIQYANCHKKCYLSNKRKNKVQRKKTKEWILKKKECNKKKGKKVAHDSKYTGRRRRMKF